MTTRFITVLSILSFLGGCGLSDEQKTSLLQKVETAVRKADLLEAQRAASVEAFASKETVAASRCDAVVMLNSLGRPRRDNGRLPMKGSGNYLHADSPDKLKTMMGTRMKKVRRRAKDLRRAIAEGDIAEERIPALEQQIARYADPGWYRYEIHYVVRKLVRGVERKGKRYPSLVSGRAFVWDYKEGKIACAADARTTAANLRVVYDRRRGPTKADYDRAYKYGLLVDASTKALKGIGLGTHHAGGPGPG